METSPDAALPIAIVHHSTCGCHARKGACARCRGNATGPFLFGCESLSAKQIRGTQETTWEIFHGRLLDSTQTRQRRSFETWDVWQQAEGEDPPNEPVLSLKLDAATDELHMVRSLDSYVWEGYDSGSNVYLSRERRKWVRERVATIRLEDFADLEALHDELICQLFRAIVGTSRLPLSSLEAPLPAFSFGQLFYCYRADVPADAGFVARLARTDRRHAFAATSSPRVGSLAGDVSARRTARGDGQRRRNVDASLVGAWTNQADALAALRDLFNEVSLSPYTDLVDKMIAFLRVLEEKRIFAAEEVVDFWSYFCATSVGI